MEKFDKSNKIVNPSLSDFESFPVWAPDDGLDFSVPLKQFNPLPDDFPWLMIKSNFLSPQGHQFDGYVIFDGTVYALELLVEDKSFGFNIGLQPEAKAELDRLREFLNEPDSQIFPLSYSTSQVTSDGTAVEGQFDPLM